MTEKKHSDKSDSKAIFIALGEFFGGTALGITLSMVIFNYPSAETLTTYPEVKVVLLVLGFISALGAISAID